MANTLLTPTVIAKEALMMLQNNLVMGSRVYRAYKSEFVKIGSSVTIRKPNRFTVTSGAGLSVQDMAEPSTSITINNQKHVDFTFSTAELTLTVEDFSERYIAPAMEQLANQVDQDLCALSDDVANSVGTPGVTPNTFAAIGSAAQKLDEMAAQQSNRSCVLNPAANWSMADALKGFFNPQGQVSTIVQRGKLGDIANLSFYMDQNINRHTNGARGGTPLMNGATLSGATSFVTNGWTSSVANRVKKGDVFTVGTVNAVNPLSRQDTGSLQQFVVTTDTNSDVSGNATLPISPAPVSSGAYQNVTALPQTSDALTFVGSASAAYPVNLAFAPSAFALATVPLEMPEGVHFAAREEYEGISLRIVRAYDINNDMIPCRIDVLYGVKTLYPEQACRICG